MCAFLDTFCFFFTQFIFRSYLILFAERSKAVDRGYYSVQIVLGLGTMGREFI